MNPEFSRDELLSLYTQIQYLYNENNINIYIISIWNPITSDAIDEVYENFDYINSDSKKNCLFIITSTFNNKVSIKIGERLKEKLNDNLLSTLINDISDLTPYKSIEYILNNIKIIIKYPKSWTPDELANSQESNVGDGIYGVYDPYGYVNKPNIRNIKSILETIYLKSNIKIYYLIINSIDSDVKEFLDQYYDKISNLFEDINYDNFIFILISANDNKMAIKLIKQNKKLPSKKIEQIINDAEKKGKIYSNLYTGLTYISKELKNTLIVEFPKWAIALIVIGSVIILSLIIFIIVKKIKTKGEKIAGIKEFIEMEL